MKFTTEKKAVPGEYTRDGITVPVTRTETVTMPRLPRDWNAVALRGAVITVLALTLAVIVWSTVKIGGLLHGGVGYVAATIFDIGWLVALLLSYMARYDKTKREFADRLGWAMLVATMGALFWAGWTEGGMAMAVVGAAVSAFAKILWIGVMKHINAELSDDDQAWLMAETSKAQTGAAVAMVRRQTAKIEQGAMLQLLAMEKEQRDVRAAFGLDQEPAVQAEAQTRELPVLPPPTLAHMGKSDAIRYVKSQLPELEATDITEMLSEEGVEVKPEYVAQVLARKSKTKSVEEEDFSEYNVVELRK